MASPTINEPTPTSLPSRLISAAPLQAGCGGEVKIASSSRYSQEPANSRLAAMRAGAARADPPKLATITTSSLDKVRGFAESDRLDLQRRDRLQQAEAGLMVVADDIGGHGAAVIRHHLGGMRLDHQIADGEHQAVLVDDDAGALALAAEILRRCARPD